jgi:hypothetical protein
MASLEAGRELADRYVLKERLGDGGHAEVWAAVDTRDGQLVALKFLHLLSCSAEEALQVLRHEARMVQQLEHPGVLQVEEPQRDGDYVFLPVEYASGGSAASLRGAHWQRVLPVLLQVAQVLEHAHARGVVHRDIKPGNVLFDAAGRVRVADFGTSARTGSSEAPADGSPFSAGPQQLRGDVADPADDVYGLGALTYELLTRYPPFYPHFDALRVQTQDPPRPVPVHPAPAGVLDLAQAMLARDAAARPSLAEVIAAFEHSLATAVVPDEGSMIIEASTQAAPAKPLSDRVRRGVAWWGLGAAVAVAALVVLNLPKPEPAATLPEPGEVAAPISVADALVVEPSSPLEPGSVEAGDAGAADAGGTSQDPAAAAAMSLPDALRNGQQALEEYRPAQARAAFQRALALQADHPAAMAGLSAAARQQELLAKLAEGTQAEAAGDPLAARERYRLLLASQPDFAPARSSLARVEARLADLEFEDHLAVAAGALRAGRVDEAADAYARAAAIHPREARVLDGQQRIAEIELDRQNALDLATGTTLEEGERWNQAIAHYRAVLERMSSLQFAQDGLARSERRAALDQELADYLARPERLAAPAVRQAAQRAMARGESSAATGAPRLRAQLVSLQAVLDGFNQPVRVAITSDNSTRVSVMQVGELGVFQARELSLPPGKYTFIGRRDGFRDVRLELSLAPGQRATALSVQCTERI